MRGFGTVLLAIALMAFACGDAQQQAPNRDTTTSTRSDDTPSDEPTGDRDRPQVNATPAAETLTLRWHPITDPLAGNIEAIRFLRPDGWSVSGRGAVWNIGFRSGGASVEANVVDDTTGRGFSYLPFIPYHWSEPPDFGFPEGSFYSIVGSIVLRPLSAADYLLAIGLPEQFPFSEQVGQPETMPTVAEVVRDLTGAEQADAARVRISYSTGSGNFEADVYAWTVYSSLGGLIVWSPVFFYAVIAPAGTLDDEKAVLDNLALSVVVNPTWAQAQNTVEQLRQQGIRENQVLTDELINTLRDTSNAIFDLTSSAWREAQAANDRIFQNYSEYIRGTETYVDPVSGPIELPGGYTDVWATGGGEYILSNDPLFDPNLLDTLTWQRIQPQ